MFTKRHHEFLAIALREARPAHNSQDWAVTVETLAQKLAEDNPRFNKQKFLDAIFQEESIWGLVARTIDERRNSILGR